MIPETYISVSYVPSTVTGKADRKPLREQFTQLPGAQMKAYFGLDDKEKAMPLTATELKMQILWAKVLNLELQEIARDDEWVSLGGDSLGAMQPGVACASRAVLPDRS